MILVYSIVFGFAMTKLLAIALTTTLSILIITHSNSDDDADIVLQRGGLKVVASQRDSSKEVAILCLILLFSIIQLNYQINKQRICIYIYIYISAARWALRAPACSARPRRPP